MTKVIVAFHNFANAPKSDKNRRQSQRAEISTTEDSINNPMVREFVRYD